MAPWHIAKRVSCMALACIVIITRKLVTGIVFRLRTLFSPYRKSENSVSYPTLKFFCEEICM
jgi:hypothetical protein